MSIFKKDFKFLFLNKEELSRPVDKMQVLNEIKRLQSIYCLDFFDRHLWQFRNAFNEIYPVFDGGHDGSNFDIRLQALKEAKEIVSPLLYKKNEMLIKLQAQHSRLRKSYPKLYSLRLSLSIKQTTMPSNVLNVSVTKERCMIMAEHIRKLLNNMRQRVLLKSKVGYFWCFMKEATGMPYIHINLYFNDGLFNSTRAMDFLELWVDATKGSGRAIFFDVPDHYSNTEVYNEKTRNTIIEGLRLPRSPIPKLQMIVDDFNRLNDSTLKYSAVASDKSFQNYLSLVVRETYPLYTLNVIAQQELKKKNITSTGSPDQFTSRFSTGSPINFDANLARTIRSYGLSQ